MPPDDAAAVPHVGVAVVQAHHQRHAMKRWIIVPKTNSLEAAKVATRPDVSEMMLAEADAAHVALEELEQVAHLERLAEVVVLVHVERLQVLAVAKVIAVLPRACPRR